MNGIRNLTRVLILLLAGATAAEAQFEGIITSKNTTVDEAGVPQQYFMTWWGKSDMVKVRTTSTGRLPGVVMLYRADRRVIWVINEADKTYLEIQQETAKDSTSIPVVRRDIRRTGKKKAIAGYRCEEVVVRNGDEETRIWGTTDLGSLMRSVYRTLRGGEDTSGPSWTGEIEKLGIFPLSSTTRFGGKVLESQEVVKIEEKSLPQSMFDLPDGFRRQRVGDMILDGMKKSGGQK